MIPLLSMLSIITDLKYGIFKMVYKHTISNICIWDFNQTLIPMYFNNPKLAKFQDNLGKKMWTIEIGEGKNSMFQFF